MSIIWLALDMVVSRRNQLKVMAPAAKYVAEGHQAVLGANGPLLFSPSMVTSSLTRTCEHSRTLLQTIV